MEINPKELQKFHDLWAPMIAALPAVINAAESANEIVQHTAMLRAELDKVVAATAASKQEQEALVAAAQAQLLELATQRLTQDAEVKGHAKECRKAIADARSAADAKVKEHTDRAAVVGLELAKADEELRKRLEAADRDFLAQKAEQEGILAALLEKQEVARATIESLRAQLG